MTTQAEFTPGDQEATLTPRPEGNHEAAKIAFFEQFDTFCNSGDYRLDLGADLPITTQPIIANAGHDFLYDRVFSRARAGTTQRMPLGLVRSSLDTYYQRNTGLTLHEGSLRRILMQQTSERDRLIPLARDNGQRYLEIALAQELREGADLMGNVTARRAMADLLTAYGMALEQLGQQFGSAALQRPAR